MSIPCCRSDAYFLPTAKSDYGFNDDRCRNLNFAQTHSTVNYVLDLLLCAFILVSGSTEITCSDMDVLNHLKLTASNDLLSMIRPVKNSKTPTSVNLDMALYAILDVREIDQTFIPYVWMYMSWKNEFTSWNSSDFCDIEKVAIPTNILWKPDITIEEMTGKDQTPPSPYVTIFSDGWVQQVDNQVLTSTCKMDIYKFPFDVQQCNLTFKSVVHSNKELRLYHVLDSNETTEWAREMMHTQYEWLFMDMEVTNTTEDNVNFGIQDVIIFSIKMRRRSVLYSTNLLLPVLFFLCLDLSSFLISDRGGEKLGFKITVLLAVTVMQLILNEILPSSSNSVPLIAVYCIGMFTLMLLNLLETILVMYLIQKDSVALDSEKQHDWSLSEDGKGLSSYEQDAVEVLRLTA
ncbi:5-hydroxytryptamine receptor 3A-like [Synchiropus splendidus]|uniref:5-hydroxytryptamine receptor 3A-like n=1 Tax=Synchiropus splendidus TaxID=270530 RepID=UPI00237ED5A9|nr:5-hydroxytryptamine receptor 3A-like [Synchiropus splendidus]